MRNLLCLVLLFVLGCGLALPPPVNPSPFDGLEFDGNLQNGLTKENRIRYYSADEGIQYLPVDVLMAMDRPVGDGLGLYEERMFDHPERFGLYPNFVNPNGPPLGITSSTDPSYVPMAGLNCSTCHTTVLQYGSKIAIIDGGQSLFAIDRFIKEMVFGLISTLTSPEEFSKFWDRYQARVAARSGKSELAKSAPEHDLEGFFQSDEYRFVKAALKERSLPPQDLRDFETRMAKRHPIRQASGTTTLTSHPYPTQAELSSGLDMYVYLVRRFAFFYAQTKYASNPPGSTVSESGLGRSNPWSVTKNMFAQNVEGLDQADWPTSSGGPVNTPVIWSFNRQHYVFWSGVTNSMLERNLAQGVALVTDFNWSTKETTVSARKLQAVSTYAEMIRPPKWPEAWFGPIDRLKAKQGKAIFGSRCLGCHDPESASTGIAGSDLNYLDVGTDPEYTKGQIASFNGKDLFADVLAPFLAQVKAGVYAREQTSDPLPFEWGRLPSVWRRPKSNQILARPLWGIWASAPFLHNGSVPSLRELLKPARQRVTSFPVGSLTYNVHDLGLDKTSWYYSSTLTVSCPTGCTGNSNAGHEFGVDLSDPDKDSLLEFIKSYGPDTEF